MDLNDIPNDATKFPTGVSEQEYNTEAEMSAFINGLDFADDIDVHHGDPFQRDGKFIVRVVVGDWDEEDSDA